MGINSFGKINLKGCKQHSSGKLKLWCLSHSFVKLKLQSSQVALSYRATVATGDKPRAEISLLNLCRGAEEGNCKLTDAFISRRREICVRQLYQPEINSFRMVIFNSQFSIIELLLVFLDFFNLLLAFLECPTILGDVHGVDELYGIALAVELCGGLTGEVERG